MDLNKFTEANRAAWDQAAPYHSKYTFDHLLEKFRKPDFNSIGPLKQELFRYMEFAGKSIVQLACNNGRDLVSLKRMGARRCVGIDISDAFIEQGKRLSESANAECEFVAADVYALPKSYHGQFDIVYLSSGTLRWMPDLPRFFNAVSELLVPNGHLVMLEMHPFLTMLAAEKLSSGSIAFCRSYFASGPYQENQGLDYYGHVRYDSTPAYWFHHSLSAILNATHTASLRLHRIDELPVDISGGTFAPLERAQIGMPLSIALIAQKPAS